MATTTTLENPNTTFAEGLFKTCLVRGQVAAGIDKAQAKRTAYFSLSQFRYYSHNKRAQTRAIAELIASNLGGSACQPEAKRIYKKALAHSGLAS